jgi:hypothetical protein
MEEKHAPVDAAQLKPGMEFCTFDFQRWGEFTAIEGKDGDTYLVGSVDGSGVKVYVPLAAVVESHGRCIRLNQPRAEIDGAGWESRPASLTD